MGVVARNPVPTSGIHCGATSALIPRYRQEQSALAGVPGPIADKIFTKRNPSSHASASPHEPSRCEGATSDSFEWSGACVGRSDG